MDFGSRRLRLRGSKLIDLWLGFWRLYDEVITKTFEYGLFDVVVEFQRCVFLSYLLGGGNLFVLIWC